MKPNVLLVTMDHERADALGCAGNPTIQTPNLDALAREGVLFSQCTSQSPVCVPSRASLMTGRYPHRCGSIWNFAPIQDGEVCLPELMRAHGYQTAVVGKHHLVGVDLAKNFDFVSEQHGKWGAVAGRGTYLRSLREQGYDVARLMDEQAFGANLAAVPWTLPEELHFDWWVGDQAVEFLEERADPNFFLWVGFHSPHHPYDPPGRFLKLYDTADLPMPHVEPLETRDKSPEFRAYRSYDGHPFAGGTWGEQTEEKLRRMIAAYCGTVSLCDEQIGRIVRLLEELGELENTLIIFTSDHGDFLGDHGVIGKGPFLYDALVHVPLIVRVPASGCNATTISSPVELVDVLPTVMDAIDAEPPAQVQGTSLWAQLRGGPFDGRGFSFSEMPGQRAVRTPEWKIIDYLGQPHSELYDLRNDPHELPNLAMEIPEKVGEMRVLLDDFPLPSKRQFLPNFKRFSGVDPLSGKEVSWWYTL